MTGMRLPYNLKEDKNILRYLLDKQFQKAWAGNEVWVQMAREQVCPDRSWQSLKNRFKRNIMRDFRRPHYGLTKEEQEALQAALTRSQDSPKHLIDPRLVRKREETKKKNPFATAKGNKEVDPQYPKPISPKKRQFYDLTNQWSDSD